MAFKSEYEMVEIFKKAYPKAFLNSNFCIHTEVSVGFGIADLVISELKENFQFMSLRERLMPVDFNIYHVLQIQKRISIENIHHATGLTKVVISKSLKKLISLNFVREEKSEFFIVEDYELSFRTTIAFEAKLKNWQRALMQAYRYKWFADQSFVVLDEHYSRKAIENISQFKNANVGLITISDKGQMCRHFIPESQKPIDKTMQMGFSEFLLFN